MTVVGHGRVAFALVANCDPYTYVGSLPVHAAPRARFDLGLDLVAPRAVAPWRLPRLAGVGLRGRGQVRSAPRAVPPRPGRARDRVRLPRRSRSTARTSATWTRRTSRRTGRAPGHRGRCPGTWHRCFRPSDVRRIIGDGEEASGRRGRGPRRRCAPGSLPRDGPSCGRTTSARSSTTARAGSGRMRSSGVTRRSRSARHWHWPRRTGSSPRTASRRLDSCAACRQRRCSHGGAASGGLVGPAGVRRRVDHGPDRDACSARGRVRMEARA